MARVVTIRDGRALDVAAVEALNVTVGALIADAVTTELDAAYPLTRPPYALNVDGRARTPGDAAIRGARRKAQLVFLDEAIAIGIDVVERYIRSMVYKRARRRTGELQTTVVYFNGREYPNVAAVPDLRAGDRASVWLTAEHAWIVNHWVKHGTGKGFAARIAQTLRRRRELQGLYIRAVFRRNAAFVGGFQPGWYFQISKLLADAQRGGRVDRRR